MKFDKVYILFEQSGTFKKVFANHGYNVTEYDIEKTENVDFDIDIFTEIDLEMKKKTTSLFHNIHDNDLVMAFFPCTYFSDQNSINSRGESYGQREWGQERKFKYSLEQMYKRNEYFSYLCKLCIIAVEKGFKLIIENPYGKINFLKWFFPLRPELIITDRRIYGDFYKKPTQFFFINCVPGFKLFQDADKTKFTSVRIADKRGFDRSRISPIFAENFCNQFIFD